MKFLFSTILLFTINSCVKMPDHCKEANIAMFSFSKEQQKKNGLMLEGFGGAMMYDIQKFGLAHKFGHLSR